MMRTIFLSAYVGAAIAGTAEARPVAAPIRPPVHPVVGRGPIVSPHAWRSGVEKSAEAMVRYLLEMRGYRVIEFKLLGNHGVDLLAVKVNARGEWIDLRLIEVKGHHGDLPTVKPTKVGYLMDRNGLDDWLRKLGNQGDEGRRLAKKVVDFCQSRAIDPVRLGELHDVNFRKGTVTLRDPITRASRTKPISLDRLLNTLAKRAKDPLRRQWALGHLSQLDQIQSSSMGRSLVASVPGYGPARVGPKPVVRSPQPRSLGAGRTLVRSAGRAVVVVAVAMDAYELYGHVAEYRAGRSSRRRLMTSLAASGTGISAAWAGGAAGAWIGVKVGALGGPFAWVTVPVGGVVGGAVGGVAGYLGGSAAGEAAAGLWYGSLDEPVRLEVDRWMAATPDPFGIATTATR